MLHDEILMLEERLLAPDVRARAEVLDELISDDFMEFGASGRVYDKARIIAALVAKPAISPVAPITDFRVIEVASDVALATYRLGNSVRSSIWRRERGYWRLLFHQGTPSSRTDPSPRV